MAKCTVCLDFDTKMSPIEPCENSGWPQLDNLCPDHYREYLIQPAINRAYDSNVFVAELQQKLYNVEVAMGLRSASFPDYPEWRLARGAQPCVAGPVKGELRTFSVIVDGRDSEIANKTRVPLRVRPSLSNEVNDLEEME